MPCNKISFCSKKDAKSFLKTCKTEIKLSPYECYYCGDWHTTSLTKKSSRKIKNHYKEIKRRVDIIKSIKKARTVDFVFSVQEKWMKLVTNDRLAYVEFTDAGNSSPIWLTPMN